MPNGISVENGQDLTCKTFLLALNHSLDQIRDLPEEFVIYGEYEAASPTGPHLKRGEVGRVRLVEFDETDGYATYPCLLSWRTGHEPRKLQIFYRSLDPRDTVEPIAASPLLPFDFWSAAWNPDPHSAEQIHQDAKEHKYWVDNPISSPGRWNLAHRFAKIEDVAVIYLWRFAAPAFFEMHSHIESNHCSPLPPAWVHIWEKKFPGMNLQVWDTLLTASAVKLLEVSYETQDKIAPKSFALGKEAGELGAKPTSEIAKEFLLQLGNGKFQEIFPFLSPNADKIGCLMPMDMEYMHYDGYFGIPISQRFLATRSDTGVAEVARWYCWNKIWGFRTNNRLSKSLQGDPIQPRYSFAPSPSENGEKWCWMEVEDNDKYESWPNQYIAHNKLFRKDSQNASVNLLPLFHFDPRRYTENAASLNDSKQNLINVLSQTIQSPTNSGKPAFFGFKLYTALGWAPLDPFHCDPLREFYTICQTHQIPLLNHGTPAGYYTHDRRHYFDLLLEEEKKGRPAKIANGNEDKFGHDGWMSQFARKVIGPNNHWVDPEDTPEKTWWFTHHYVSAQAWAKVLAIFPHLKICLAHFGDSDHLRDNSWVDRQFREPKQKDSRKLTLEFVGDQIDPTRTHRFLYDLLMLVQENNSVFVDLSFVILTEQNAAKFTHLFEWARLHKPILLERILWGTDWPLIGNEDPVTSTKGGNMLHRYAKGFKQAIPKIPSDFFLRACFLNPLQYLDLRGIREKVKASGASSPWAWVDDLNPSIFDMHFKGDKTHLLYGSPKFVKMGLH